MQIPLNKFYIAGKYMAQWENVCQQSPIRASLVVTQNDDLVSNPSKIYFDRNMYGTFTLHSFNKQFTQPIQVSNSGKVEVI